jgi:hypothetical protein
MLRGMAMCAVVIHIADWYVAVRFNDESGQSVSVRRVSASEPGEWIWLAFRALIIGLPMTPETKSGFNSEQIAHNCAKRGNRSELLLML